MDADLHQPDLARRVEEALRNSPRLNPGDIELKVEVHGDTVVLRGRVKHLREKRRAESLAGAVPGVRRVVNRLELDVYPRRSDSEILQGVQDALMQDRILSQCDLRVSVKDGIVRLGGKVPTLVRKRLAGGLAWWIPGVLDVQNEIEVSPPEEDSDEQISEACMALLDKDPFVAAEGIFVWTQGGVVKLSGVVRGESERQAAESDAWYIWGVRDVINDLIVSRE